MLPSAATIGNLRQHRRARDERLAIELAEHLRARQGQAEAFLEIAVLGGDLLNGLDKILRDNGDRRRELTASIVADESELLGGRRRRDIYDDGLYIESAVRVASLAVRYCRSPA